MLPISFKSVRHLSYVGLVSAASCYGRNIIILSAEVSGSILRAQSTKAKWLRNMQQHCLRLESIGYIPFLCSVLHCWDNFIRCKGLRWCIYTFHSWLLQRHQDNNVSSFNTWWRNQMEIFSASLAICAGNSPVTGEFPSKRPVTRSFDVFFDLRQNIRLSKQLWFWWFETPSRPLWHHGNELWR